MAARDSGKINDSGGRRLRIGLRHARLSVACLAALTAIPGHAAAQKGDGQQGSTSALSREARMLYDQGRYAEAIPLYLQLVETRERTLGADHPSTVIAVNNLAVTYKVLGRYADAEPLYLRTLDTQERLLGADHQDTLTSVNNLGQLYEAQGRYADAEPLLLRALEARERTLGPDHPQTLLSVDNLASLYARQRRDAEAEALALRALEGRERTLGPEDRRTVDSVNNLAVIYINQGRYVEAEPLYTRALQASVRTLGEDHPDTLTSLNSLAGLYRRQGRYIEAEPLFIRALEVRESRLGAEHPETLGSVAGLAALYQVQDRYRDAEAFYLRALEARERTLGPDHPDTLDTMGNFALLYRAQGRFAEAEALNRRELESRTRTLGEDHFSTLRSMGNLAALYRAQSRFDEAEALYSRVIEAGEDRRGAAQAAALASADSLAAMYRSQGREAQAETMYLRTLEARESGLGPDHASTLRSVVNLARLYTSQSRYSEAEPLYLRALDARERTLGAERPATLDAVNDLAKLYLYQHRYAEAETLDLRALSSRERTLGPEHPSTLVSVNNLAVVYDFQGRYAEAEPLYLRAVEARERTVGAEHPETLTALNNLGANYVDQGRYAEAEPLLLRALEARERTHDADRGSRSALYVVRNLARLYDAQSRSTEAERYFARALAGRERLLGEAHQDILVSAQELAEARLGMAGENALPPARLLVAGLRARRSDDSGNRFAEAQSEREDRIGGSSYTLFADAAWVTSEDRSALRPESFTALQDAMSGPANRSITEMAVRRLADSAGQGLGELVRERTRLTDRWRSNNQRLGFAFGGSTDDDRAMRARIGEERVAIEARMDAIDARLQAEFPDYFALIRPEALAVAEAQALLGPDEAILLVVPGTFGTHVMAVTHDAIRWQRAEWTAEDIGKAVNRLRWDVGASVAVSEAQAAEWEDEYVEGMPFSYDRATAYALYRQIVAPIAETLEGKRELFVAAGGALAGLPFSILVTEEPQGADNDAEALRGTRWFADAHALTHIPSIQSLQLLRQVSARGDGAPTHGAFVGFGNPVLSGRSMQRGGRGFTAPGAEAVFSRRQARSGLRMADVGALRNLAQLPGTQRELQNIRRALDAPEDTIYLAERATESAVRAADLSGVRILAFATHGLTGLEMTNLVEPGLVFTPPPTASEEDDGYLSASEVSTLRLDADWVILSACNTATGDGSGLSSLARAFFYAGAHNLLASHWPVDDEVASRVTVDTIERRRDNPDLSRAGAFQQAIREIREDASHDTATASWAHPAYWAPFVLIGGAQ